MAHSPQIVDLIGFDFTNQLGKVGGVGQVTIMEEETHFIRMAITIDVLNAGSVERRRTADDAMHYITLFVVVVVVMVGVKGVHHNIIIIMVC